MMSQSDRMIEQALASEEQELLRRIGEEPGYLEQAAGLFRGSTGWVNIVLMIAQGAAFVGGVWAAWHFFAASDVLGALRWGLPAATLLLISLIMKMALWPTIHLNRLLKEVKLVQLQLARSERAGGGELAR
jgi:hypothetical protein